MRRAALAVPVAVALVAAAAAATTAAGKGGPSAATFGARPGGFAAYHGTRIAKDPAKSPAKHAVHYSGPKLVLSQSYIARKSAEPTLIVGQTGTGYTVAPAFDPNAGHPPKTEPGILAV